MERGRVFLRGFRTQNHHCFHSRLNSSNFSSNRGRAEEEGNGEEVRGEGTEAQEAAATKVIRYEKIYMCDNPIQPRSQAIPASSF